VQGLLSRASDGARDFATDWAALQRGISQAGAALFTSDETIIGDYLLISSIPGLI
jgi:hypothetical protein